MISGKLKKAFSILKLIAEEKSPTARKKLLSKYAKNKDFFLAIKELVVNCLEGNLKLSPTNKNRLQKHKRIIRQLATKKAVNNRKKLVVQSGGFLPFLVPAAATALGSILKDVLL